MAVYVFAGNNSEVIRKARKLVLEKGLAVFGWGYDSSHDLNNSNSNQHYGKTKFLLNIQPDDKIIYVNYDSKIQDYSYSLCTIMSVTGGYEFNKEIYDSIGDLANTIKIDPHSIYTFNRNNPSIHRVTSKSLKPRSAYQKLYDIEKLEESLNNHKNKIESNYFESEISEAISKIVASIQANRRFFSTIIK